MPNGEPLPFISQESVRSALDALVHVSTPRLPNPLERLLLVDEFLADPDFPPVQNSRQFALNCVVISIITEEYHRLRTIFDMPPPENNATIEKAVAHLAADLQRGSFELVGWGLLYFRHVRSDLGLSIDALSEAIPADARTLRRYQQRAIRKLTEQLIQREQVARRQQRKRRLLSKLPSSVATKLYGREDTLQEVRQFLKEHGRRHILVTGAPGIGKSTLVEEALRELIQDEALDQLIWLHQPSTPESIRRHLIEHLLPENSSISLREYLLIYRVGIALDGVERLHSDLIALQGLLDELSAALVFLTSRLFLPLHKVTKHIVLGELDEADSIALARTVVGSHLVEKAAPGIYDIVGGNPLAVKLFAQCPAPVRTVPDELYAQIHGELDGQLQRAWYIFALLPPGDVDPSSFYELWPARFTQEHVVALAHHYLIEVASQHPPLYRLTSLARKYIEQLYTSSQNASRIIDELLYELNLSAVPAVLEVCEHILLGEWLEEHPELQSLWVAQLWRAGVGRGRYANWCNILEEHLHRTQSEDISLWTAYGICLRRLAQWSDAERVFQRATRLAGQTGLFREQAKALLELSVLHRYQGRYEQANRLLTQIEATLQRRPDDELALALKMERARHAIDVGDGRKALLMLADIHPPLSPVQQILRSEAYLLCGDWRLCLDLAHQALEMSENIMGFDALVYSLMGRCYAQQGELASARRYLELAVTILERGSDPFALARARTNLAAVLIQKKDYNEAYALLEQAAALQRLVGDQFGLAATGHNIRLLQQIAGPRPWP